MKTHFAKDNELKLHSESDALDVLSSGLPGCIFFVDDLHPEFFDLANQIAGQVLQKFVNYSFPIAIVIPEQHSYGERIDELIRDHRAHPYVQFFHTSEAAQTWLQQRLT